MPSSRDRCLLLLLTLTGAIAPSAQQSLAGSRAEDERAAPPATALARLIDQAVWLPPRARDAIAHIVLAEGIESPTLTINDSDLFAARDRLFGVQPRDATQGIGVNLERDLFGGVPPSPIEVPGPGVALLPDDAVAAGVP